MSAEPKTPHRVKDVALYALLSAVFIATVAVLIMLGCDREALLLWLFPFFYTGLIIALLIEKKRGVRRSVWFWSVLAALLLVQCLALLERYSHLA